MFHVLYSTWQELVYRDISNMEYHGTDKTIQSLNLCASYHDHYFCITQVLSYIIASHSTPEVDKYSLNQLVEDCSIVVKDSHWAYDEQIWDIAFDNNCNNLLTNLLMAYCSLFWFHDPPQVFDLHDDTTWKSIYNNRVRVGNAVLYNICQQNCKPPDMPLFVWLCHFSYAISLATDLERLLAPP